MRIIASIMVLMACRATADETLPPSVALTINATTSDALRAYLRERIDPIDALLLSDAETFDARPADGPLSHRIVVVPQKPGRYVFTFDWILGSRIEQTRVLYVHVDERPMESPIDEKRIYALDPGAPPWRRDVWDPTVGMKLDVRWTADIGGRQIRSEGWILRGIHHEPRKPA